MRKMIEYQMDMFRKDGIPLVPKFKASVHRSLMNWKSKDQILKMLHIRLIEFNHLITLLILIPWKDFILIVPLNLSGNRARIESRQLTCRNREYTFDVEISCFFLNSKKRSSAHFSLLYVAGISSIVCPYSCDNMYIQRRCACMWT